MDRRFDRAFGIALAHRIEWKQIPGLMAPPDDKELDLLVDRCRAQLVDGGDPEVIPPPRSIETAPVPRSKDGGDAP